MASHKLPTYDEALAATIAVTPAVGDESVALAAALGRVLRREVVADRDQPPFDRSAMDGFAVRAERVKPGVVFSVVGSIAAGGPMAEKEPGEEEVFRIATGAPVPAGWADAVIPIEQAVVEKSATGARETVRFTMERVLPGANIHRRASDAAAGQVLLAAGTRLGPQQLGIAAAVGGSTLSVAMLPRITLLTTGDEVRPAETPGGDLGPQQIRNSNAPMLAALLTRMGGQVLGHEHIPDDPERSLEAARRALSQSHVVVSVGGVSVGQRDYMPWAWQQLGLKTVVQGVAIQPGKPVFIAADDCKLVVGLPGNPVSALATAHLFIWPVLRRMSGQAGLAWRGATLAEETAGSGSREVFRAARWTAEGKARVIRWHGSGDLVHTGSAQGLVRLPLRDGPLEPGTEVSWLDLIDA